jgi:hypothetical protein
MLALGLLLRANALNANFLFEDDQNGIRGLLPADWLLDTTNPDYVFRIEDPDARQFKTQIRVTVQTVGPDASPRNVVDLLELQGAAELADYRVLSVEPTRLGEDEAIKINYSFTQTEPNPFLQTLPVVVQGVDWVVLRGNQAVIMTYRDAAPTFDRHYYHFERFLRTVEY